MVSRSAYAVVALQSLNSGLEYLAADGRFAAIAADDDPGRGDEALGKFEFCDSPTSCEAVVIVKHKARPCEPWVASKTIVQSSRARHREG